MLMVTNPKKKFRYCKNLFLPGARNAKRQEFCSQRGAHHSCLNQVNKYIALRRIPIPEKINAILSHVLRLAVSFSSDRK